MPTRITREGNTIQSQILVVNKRTHPDATCSEVTRVYVGRPSVLGNPFVIGKDGTREDVIKKYENWLRPHAVRGKTEPQNAVRQELDRISELLKLADVELACWCAPLPCHASIIKKVIEEECG